MARHLRSFSDPLVVGVVINHLLIAMQQLSNRGEVVHIGGSGDDRVDQA